MCLGASLSSFGMQKETQITLTLLEVKTEEKKPASRTVGAVLRALKKANDEKRMKQALKEKAKKEREDASAETKKATS